MFPVRHQTVMDFPPKSHRKLAAHPKRYSLPHFRNAVVVISIQRCNKNHINSGFFFFLASELISYTFYLKSSHTHFGNKVCLVGNSSKNFNINHFICQTAVVNTAQQRSSTTVL